MGVILIFAVPFVLAAMYALWQRKRWVGSPGELRAC